jgi:hypothetical protein
METIMAQTEKFLTCRVKHHEEWTLYEVSRLSLNGWKSLHLKRSGLGAPKTSWWLGWNGERLARNRDLALLAEHHGDVLNWVYKVLDGGVT